MKKGFIENINENNIHVRVPGLMDGVVSYENMPEQTRMTEKGKIKGLTTGRTYKVGHKVLLNVLNASYVDNTIYYSLVDNLTITESETKKLTKTL